MSIRQGCKTVGLADSTYRYQRREKDDVEIIDALGALVEKHPSVGFWQSFYRFRLQGHECNHKRVYRVYTSLGLPAIKHRRRRRAKKRLPARVKQQLFQPDAPNQVWSLDFMHDIPPRLGGKWNGRTFRMLNVIDDYNRQVLRIETDTSLPAQRVVRVLEQLKEVRGLPNMILVDNGPEFISHRLDAWCKDHKITLAFIQPVWQETLARADPKRLCRTIQREYPPRTTQRICL